MAEFTVMQIRHDVLVSLREGGKTISDISDSSRYSYRQLQYWMCEFLNEGLILHDSLTDIWSLRT